MNTTKAEYKTREINGMTTKHKKKWVTKIQRMS